MTRIGINSMVQASHDLPNEVCLTLYFQRIGLAHSGQRVVKQEKDFSEWVRQLLSPQVGGWQEVGGLRIERAGKNMQTGYLALKPQMSFQSVYFLVITPKLSSDTYALQIIINLIEPIDKAWASASAWLRDELHILFNDLPEKFLGHSVVFRANIDAEGEDQTVELDSTVLNALPTVFPKFPIESPHLLKQQFFPGQGWLSLVAVPQVPGGGLVYVALGQANQGEENYLAHEAYATYDGLLTSLDLFYHKGVKQGMELERKHLDYDQEVVEPLKDSIRGLLLPDASDRQPSESDLVRMSRKVEQQTNFYWVIDRLEHSINQQISGIGRLFTHSSVTPIASFHLAILSAYQDEVRAYVRKNKTVLDTARAAISLVEARESKHSGRIQERFNYIVAYVGIFLASDQILDKEFAEELLIWLGSYRSDQPIPYWTTFLTHIGVAVALAALLFGCFELIKHFWRRR